MELQTRFTGGRQLAKELKALGEKVEKRIGRRALRNAGKELAEKVRADLPEDRGQLKDRVKVGIPRGTPRDSLHMQVGVSGAARSYAHIIEYGNESIRADGTWRKVFEKERGNITGIVLADLRKSIDREVGRAERRTKAKS